MDFLNGRKAGLLMSNDSEWQQQRSHCNQALRAFGHGTRRINDYVQAGVDTLCEQFDLAADTQTPIDPTEVIETGVGNTIEYVLYGCDRLVSWPCVVVVLTHFDMQSAPGITMCVLKSSPSSRGWERRLVASLYM